MWFSELVHSEHKGNLSVTIKNVKNISHEYILYTLKTLENMKCLEMKVVGKEATFPQYSIKSKLKRKDIKQDYEIFLTPLILQTIKDGYVYGPDIVMHVQDLLHCKIVEELLLLC